MLPIVGKRKAEWRRKSGTTNAPLWTLGDSGDRMLGCLTTGVMDNSFDVQTADHQSLFLHSRFYQLRRLSFFIELCFFIASAWTAHVSWRHDIFRVFFFKIYCSIIWICMFFKKHWTDDTVTAITKQTESQRLCDTIPLEHAVLWYNTFQIYSAAICFAKASVPLFNYKSSYTTQGRQITRSYCARLSVCLSSEAAGQTSSTSRVRRGQSIRKYTFAEGYKFVLSSSIVVMFQYPQWSQRSYTILLRMVITGIQRCKDQFLCM